MLMPIAGKKRVSAGDHEPRRAGASTVLDGAPLFRIETLEVGGCRQHRLRRPCVKKLDSLIPLVATTTSAFFGRDGVDPEPVWPIDSYALMRTNQEQSGPENV
jgi:hypothetical protein